MAKWVQQSFRFKPFDGLGWDLLPNVFSKFPVTPGSYQSKNIEWYQKLIKKSWRNAMWTRKIYPFNLIETNFAIMKSSANWFACCFETRSSNFDINWANETRIIFPSYFLCWCYVNVMFYQNDAGDTLQRTRLHNESNHPLSLWTSEDSKDRCVHVR